jgi:hypothetical protein
MTRLRVLVCLALLACPGLVQSATWTRDDAGLPAPPNVYSGTGGQQTIVNATNRLPVQTATEAGIGAPPTTSSTDPTGWGQKWFTSTFIGSTGGFIGSPLPLAETLIYTVARAEVANQFDIWLSTDKGATFTKKIASVAVGGIPSNTQPGKVLRLTNGNTLIAATCPGLSTPQCYGLVNWAATGAFAQIIPTGIPNGLAGGGISALGQNGSTVLALYSNSPQGYNCRSTDGGVTFSCTSAYLGANPFLTGDTLDSPAPSLWVRWATTGIQRSVDDGLSWTQTFAHAVAGPGAAIKCLSSTICVAVDGAATMYRSADGGITWATAYTHTTNSFYIGLLNYGNGVVAAIGNIALADVLLSRDYGVTWDRVFTWTGTPRCNVPCIGATVGGVGLWSNVSAGAWLDRMAYSPSQGQGQMVITGPSGFPLGIDSAGRITANQGAQTSSVPGSWLVTLTNQVGGIGYAVTPVMMAPVQGPTLFNSQTTGAANTPVVVTIAAAANIRAHVYFIRALCSTLTAQLTITDGASTVFQTTATEIGTTPFYFPVNTTAALTGSTNSAVVVTLGACGAGNTGTLTVWADRF